MSFSLFGVASMDNMSYVQQPIRICNLGPVWFARRQTCLDQAERPGVGFPAPGAEMHAWA